MMRRVWTAYRVEAFKAVRQRLTFLGPALLVLTTLSLTQVQPVVRDGHGDYAFVAHATSVSLHLVGLLLLLMYCANLISSELQSGVIRTVLVRSLRRSEYVAAKILLGGTYALVLTLTSAVAAWAVAAALGDMAGVTYGDEILFTHPDMIRAYALGVVLSLAPQLATVAFAVLMSALFRGSGVAVTAAVGIWIAADAVKHPLGIAPYLFSSYVEMPWQVFANQANGLDGRWWPDAGYCLATSGIAFVIATALAMWVMHRRNLHL